MRPELVRGWGKGVLRDPVTSVMRDAAANAGARVPLLNWDVMNREKQLHTFSHTVSPRMKVSNQENSGRCWAFAGLSILRRALAKRLDIEDKAFELSQSHIMFYDKLEKAHAFLRWVRELGDDVADDDRRLLFLLDDPIHDGGTWHAFVHLVRKYGVVPAVVMPETGPSTHSRALNRMLRTLLLQAAGRIRRGEPVDDDEVLLRVHRLLCVCMGGPPPESRFEWSFEAKGGKVRTRNETALELLDACGVPLEDYVLLTHTPSRTKRLGVAYTVDYLDPVLGAPPALLYNVPLRDLVRAAYRTLRDDGTAVYFACEYGPMRLLEDGLLHHELVRYDRAIGEGLDTREHRVDARAVSIDHAMLFTGYHVDEDKVIERWQVENSHGDAYTEGYLSMSSGWFSSHVFHVAVPRRYAPPDLDRFEVVTLPPWDVIGSVMDKFSG